MGTFKRTKPKTWSLLGDVRRKPTDYEVVTYKFLNHFRQTPAPFEISPSDPINQWYLRYREGSPLQVEDWESFRDPHRLTYRQYTLLQHDRETYLDLLIDEHESKASLEDMSPEWVRTLHTLIIPMRFPLHVLQMASSYVSQMAPTAFVVNCATFQAADEMRRVQRLAYWTKALSLVHGENLAATGTARDAWENDAAWQPLRRSLEELLTVRDWGEAFTALNLVLKPALDALLNVGVSSLARKNGDDYLASLLTEFGHDSRRSRDWSIAMVRYAVERRPELQRTLNSWIARWQPLADEAVSALSVLFTAAPTPLPAHVIVGYKTKELNAIRQDCKI